MHTMQVDYSRSRCKVLRTWYDILYCNITIELLHNVYIWNYKIGKVALHAQQWIPASESEKEAYFGFEETNTRSSACWSPGIRGLKCSSKGSLASPERERRESHATVKPATPCVWYGSVWNENWVAERRATVGAAISQWQPSFQCDKS